MVTLTDLRYYLDNLMAANCNLRKTVAATKFPFLFRPLLAFVEFAERKFSAFIDNNSGELFRSKRVESWFAAEAICEEDSVWNVAEEAIIRRPSN